MNEQLKQLGLTPFKAGAIGVLLLLFAAVWGPQILPGFGGSSNSEFEKVFTSPAVAKTSKPIDKRSRIPAIAPARSHGSSEKTEVLHHSPSREYSLVKARSYDPFKIPVWAPQPKQVVSETTLSGAEEDRLARIEELQETGVAMVLVSGKQQVAAIGEQILRVGDEIDGFRVVEISSDGVLLMPTGNKASSERPRAL